MNFLKKITFSLITLSAIVATPLSVAENPQQLPPNVVNYIKKIEKKYKFNHDALSKLFSNTHANQEIINKMTHPYEKKSWPQYRKLFITQTKIDNGAKFWAQHKKVLMEAEKKYHIPARVIVAIMGIETNYGEHKGKYPVIESLATLAFHYKPRSKFFTNELTQYLLLAREQKLDPTQLTGSYAGAIGIPQFMPSTYRRYAIDYSKKGSADLVNDINDAIFSIAYFLDKKGWKQNQPVAMALADQLPIPKSLLSNSAKPHYSLLRLKKYGVKLPQAATPYLKWKASVIAMDMGEKKVNNYWLTFANFRAIMRYNPRINYAMVVYQLSGLIQDVYSTNTIRARTKATEPRPTA